MTKPRLTVTEPSLLEEKHGTNIWLYDGRNVVQFDMEQCCELEV